MRILLSLTLVFLLDLAISPGQMVVRRVGKAAAAGSVSINNHWFYNTGCSGGSTTCAPTSKVISATGDTEVTTMQFCIDVGCVLATTNCVIAVTDGTNPTYTSIAAARVTDGGGVNWNVWPFYAKNAAAGTYTITATISACTAGTPGFFYGGMYGADFVGANTTTPIDSSVSNAGSSSSTAAPTLSGAGTVTNNNSMGYAYISGANAITLNGGACGSSFTAFLDGTAGNSSVAANSGATLKICGTQTAGWATYNVIAVTP